MNNTIDGFWKVTPWTSSRVYLGPKETRAVISDEKHHTFTELDGDSAKIWSFLQEGTTVEEIVSEFPRDAISQEEISQFLSELEELELVATEDSLDSMGDSADDVPTPVPLEFGKNVMFESEFMEWVIDNGFLWSVHWELTYRCNESCVHCYNPGAAHIGCETPDRVRDELSTSEAFDVIDRFVELGLFRLTISGGEIFLRKDILEIVRYARKRGVSVDLYTNGLKLGEAVLDELAELWPRSVSVSVYSDVASEHDKVTRVHGSHERSMECLRGLSSRGIKSAMKSVSLATTVDGNARLRSIAEDMGVAFESEASLSHGADGAKAPVKVGITDIGTMVEMAMTPGAASFVGGPEDDYSRVDKDKSASVCGAGISALHLDPEGNIMPCASLPIMVGNVKEMDVRELWRSAIEARGVKIDISDVPKSDNEMWASRPDVLASWQAVRLGDYLECGTHDRCDWCQKCPGKAMLEHGDPLAPSTQDCRLSLSRMWATELLQAGLQAGDLNFPDDIIYVEPLAESTRLEKTALSSHSIEVIKGLNACGSCEEANFCSGSSQVSVFDTTGGDVVSGSEEMVEMLEDANVFYKEHISPLLSQQLA